MEFLGRKWKRLLRREISAAEDVLDEEEHEERIEESERSIEDEQWMLYNACRRHLRESRAKRLLEGLHHLKLLLIREAHLFIREIEIEVRENGEGNKIGRDERKRELDEYGQEVADRVHRGDAETHLEEALQRIGAVLASHRYGLNQVISSNRQSLKFLKCRILGTGGMLNRLQQEYNDGRYGGVSTALSNIGFYLRKKYHNLLWKRMILKKREMQSGLVLALLRGPNQKL
ncbi:MAG: hypothetical protein ABH879_01720 [archaeon]